MRQTGKETDGGRQRETARQPWRKKQTNKHRQGQIKTDMYTETRVSKLSGQQTQRAKWTKGPKGAHELLFGIQ